MSVVSSAALHFFPFLPKIFSVRLGLRSGDAAASRIGPPTPLADPCFCSAGGADRGVSDCRRGAEKTRRPEPGGVLEEVRVAFRVICIFNLILMH